MKPPVFDYFAATSASDAVAALARVDEARVLAGGQSLVPLMNLRLARPELVIDLNGATELDFVEATNGTVRIGALTRHRRLELDADIARTAPLLTEAASLVGHPPIRNRATLGGSIAHADPSAELAAALVALEGVAVVEGPAGRREIAASHLFEGYFTTTIAPDELLVELRVPVRAEGSGHAFREHAPRHGDFALAGIGAVVELGNGVCTKVRLAGCGLGSTPLDLTECAIGVIGASEPADNLVRDVARRVGGAVAPVSDMHGSADYRGELAQMLTVAAPAAWNEARGNGSQR